MAPVTPFCACAFAAIAGNGSGDSPVMIKLGPCQ